MGQFQHTLIGSVLVALLLLAGLGGFSPAQSQDSIQVISNQVSVEYPASIRFDLIAVSNDAPIISARLVWRASQEEVFRTASLEGNFRHSRNVSLGWTLPTQSLQLPPFAQITYRWQLRDENGNELTTEDFTVEYVDTRHDWQELANERLRLLWYDLDETFAQELFAIADAAYLRLADYFGVTLAHRPVIVIYPDQRDFAEFQRFLLNVESVIGRYFPGHNVTVNLVTPDMPRQQYEETIAHELSHLYTDHYYVGAARLPLWLDEGLATYNEDPDHRAELALVQRAAARNALLPFIDLPAGIRASDVRVANLAYAEGATVFQFILDTWGDAALSAFLNAFRQTTDVNRVTTEQFGLTQAGFEIAWRTWLGYPVDSVPELIVIPTLDLFNIPTPTPYPTPG